jgi:hypothetical protein
VSVRLDAMHSFHTPLCIWTPLSIWIRYGFHRIAARNPGFYGDKKGRCEIIVSTDAESIC